MLEDQLDVDALIWDIRRRSCAEELPATPLVACLDITDGRRHATRFLLLRRSEVSLCGENPGLPEELRIAVSLRTWTAWWRGDITLAGARASGMVIDGRREWARAFPRWFERYVFADVSPAAWRYGFRTGHRRPAPLGSSHRSRTSERRNPQ